MRSWWGTLVGVLLGAFGGVPGALFGGFIGFLVDLVTVEFRVQRAAIRYLERDTAPSWLPRELPLAGNLLGSLHRHRASVAALDIPARLSEEMRPFFPDRFARRPVERVIAAAMSVVWIGDEPWCARLRRDTGLPSREALFTGVWETLVRTGSAAGVRDHVHELARRAELGPEFIAEHLRVRELRDAEACAILGVARDATQEEIRVAYRRLAAQFHPDTATHLSEEQQRATEDAFKRIQAAYDALK
ncbi:MAG: DnaJ domain-containing protein [Spirochaetota bacterium]